MFEITYKDNALPGALLQREKAVYDFTFENKYHIYHRPRRNAVEYICYDTRTGCGSRIFERKAPLVREEYFLMIPDILAALHYTGDCRGDGSFQSPDNIIDLIFRAIMPRYGYAIREPQIQMAKTICDGLSHKRVTLCEAEVGSGKTMAYLVAAFAAKYFDQTYKFQGYPVTITTSSIELQKAIMEKELPALSSMLVRYGLIKKPLTAVLRKGKEHYFCPKRYVPVPNIDSPLYIPTVANEVVRLIRATHGHTAVLFTSYKALAAVYDLVSQEITEYPLFMMSRKNRTTISQFKQSTNGVLFASGSMWEGVDCPGDILSSVIIVRLPFPLRSHALDSKLETVGSMQSNITGVCM